MSIRIYPVIPTDPQCNDYTVKVNGIAAPLHTARVSAMPFNRRWPGHQRPLDQSEAIQFLSMASDEPLSFEILPNRPFDASQLKIRPQSLGIVPTVTPDGKITFTLPRPAYFTIEPYGRSRALHLFVDPMQDYGIDRTDPNLLYFGAGEHHVGQIELHSNQTLFLDEGAVVYACIHAIDAQNIRILGHGILDNSENKEQILFEAEAQSAYTALNNATRQHTLQLEYCDNVIIDGITVRDSLVYNIRPIGCQNLTIKHVKIIGCWRYNSDGIDMHNCIDVHISDCFIRTFDDSICVKGFDIYYEGDVEEAVRNAMYRNGKSYDVFQNALIENCVIWNDWGVALEIGAETRAEEITNIHFRNCDLIHLIGPALGCMNVDYADVHNLTYKDIRIEADEKIPKVQIQESDADTYAPSEAEEIPSIINYSVVFHHEYSAGGGRRGKNRDIRFERISVLSPHAPRLTFCGYDEAHKTENVLISDLFWNNVPVADTASTQWDVQKYTDNIRLEVNPYAELEKNTVQAQGQLDVNEFVTFAHAHGTGLRVLFVGNSITRHGILPEIGWYQDHGMAASCREKDYVHLMQDEILKKHPDAAFCICQVADWEVNYRNGAQSLPLYERARRFDADVIILRLIENCPGKDFDGACFQKELDALLCYLNASGKAKAVATTGFWSHPGDAALTDYAEKHGIPCAYLGDLGQEDRMKAIGLFAHAGVANHPGDEGMRAIADRILGLLEPYL